jgi:hypothetical protein
VSSLSAVGSVFFSDNFALFEKLSNSIPKMFEKRADFLICGIEKRESL